MKSRHLRSITLKPIAVPVCAACKEFRPDCEVPHREGTLPMCWICAHHFIDHGIKISECGGAECECLPEAIYPESNIAARRAAGSN